MFIADAGGDIIANGEFLVFGLPLVVMCISEVRNQVTIKPSC